MSTPKKKFNKGLIVLNKGERIAMFNLLGMIVIFLAYSVFRPMIRLSENDRMAFHNLDSLLALQEAAKEEPKEMERTEKADPPPSHKNVVTASKAPPERTKTTMRTTREYSPIELNHSDSTALTALPQIGQVMASRIHRYRNRLGGFVSYEQLFEIKGMDSARFETIKPYLLLDKNAITKIDVNRDEFKTLLRHPYLEYEQVKAIVNHRERKGLIKDWNQLASIVEGVNPLLKEYVTY